MALSCKFHSPSKVKQRLSFPAEKKTFCALKKINISHNDKDGWDVFTATETILQNKHPWKTLNAASRNQGQKKIKFPSVEYFIMKLKIKCSYFLMGLL